tara:strand:- start:104 stop:412 length:309 start_codon:yes stop_codon:yes gene_type:complete
MYDPLSPVSWDIEGYGTVHVGDSFFNDHERVLAWYTIEEITLEPVSGDPNETNLEPVFWVSDMDINDPMELTESELVTYLPTKQEKAAIDHNDRQQQEKTDD